MQSAPINLVDVRRLFSSPSRVEGAQFLFREIANRMAEKLDLIKIQPRHVLDLGCGLGVDIERLIARFPEAVNLTGVDGSCEALMQSSWYKSEGMGTFESLLNRFSLLSKKAPQVDLICANFANLPLRSKCADVVWSNLALHWHPEPDKVLREWHRVLANDGLVIFSCFGPDTFIELKRAFATADDFSHILAFVDMHDFGDMLGAAGFAAQVMDVERITLSYANVGQLFADVRAMGGNPLDSRRRSLMGKNAMAKVRDYLERSRGQDGRIPLTIEVVFGHAFKPVPTKLATGESIIRFDFPKK